MYHIKKTKLQKLKGCLGSKGKKVLKEIKENDLKAVPATNSVPAPHLKKLSAGDVVDLVVDDEEKSPPTKKPKLYYERIIMGEELTDMEIDHAQQLLKAKHPNFNDFQSTLVARKLGRTFKLFTVPAGTTG